MIKPEDEEPRSRISKSLSARAEDTCAVIALSLKQSSNSLYCEFVSHHSESSNSAVSDWCNNAGVAPRFAGIGIGDMYFNHWARESCESIMKAPRVMRECASVNDDRINSSTSAMYCINELTLVVSLKIFHSETGLTGPVRNARHVIGKCCGPINLGLALS